MPRIDEVPSLIGAFKTRECQIVSTLYAAWNDLLIRGGSTDDAVIFPEASSAERWHKSKEHIAPERWKKALQWMKDKSLVPVGYGSHTRHTAGRVEPQVRKPMILHKEIHFEVEIAEHLGTHGWMFEDSVSTQCDRAHAMFPENVIAWVQESQPEA